MASHDRIRFAVVGLGIGLAHIRAIEEEPGAELAAVSSTDEAALQGTAEKHGVPAFADYREVLSRDDVDVVCVCVPSGLHAEVGIAAARPDRLRRHSPLLVSRRVLLHRRRPGRLARYLAARRRRRVHQPGHPLD
jgi:hypothetical protein